MFKKFIDEYNVENVKKDGYLIIDSEKHLIMNIQNQPIEVLNSNGIYEYVEDTEPEITENQYLETYYYIENNVMHKGYTVKEFDISDDIPTDQIYGGVVNPPVTE